MDELSISSAASARISEMMEKEMMAADPSLKKFHVTLGPDAVKMTDEELMEHVREMNRVISEERAIWNAKPEHEKLAYYLRKTMNALREIQDLGGNRKIDEWLAMSDGERELRSKIFNIAESTLIPINRTETFDPREKKV